MMQLAVQFRERLLRDIREHRLSHSFLSRPFSDIRLNGRSIKAAAVAQDRRIVRDLIALCRKIDADLATRA